MFRTIFFLTIIGLLYSCKDDDVVDSPSSFLEFGISYDVGGDELLEDSIAYKNQADIEFSISRLEYFLSDVAFHRNGKWASTQNYAYLNPFGTSDRIRLEIEPGNYDSVGFHIGLSSSWNKSNALPSRLNYMNMAWPDVMGGGYHFLKFEGHYLDSMGASKGFALHVGKDESLRWVAFPLAGSVHDGTNMLHFRMDILEWMGAIHTMNFHEQPPYTMGIDSLMFKLADNGSRVFEIIKQE